MKSDSIVDACIEESLENSKCVVSQFRTTAQQKSSFEDLIVSCKRTQIPIEWVIDIADESNGWFYGTAYHFDDTTKMLHVMVPDKNNPSFDGQVILDYRTVHLVECVDGKSDALFNKLIRDSILKIKWELEWFEEELDENGQPAVDPNNNDEPAGRWIPSAARYFIRMANQLLVEDQSVNIDQGAESTAPVKGYVMITADLNVKLCACNRNRGFEDFQRLIGEGITSYSPEAYDAVLSSARGSTDDNGSLNNPTVASVRKLSDITNGLKDAVNDLLEERDKLNEEKTAFADLYYNFTLNGNLDSGLALMSNVEHILNRSYFNDEKANNKERDANFREHAFSQLADETTFQMQKLEKGMMKLVQIATAEANGDLSGRGSQGGNEMDILMEMQLKMKLDMDEKDKELRELKEKLKMI